MRPFPPPFLLFHSTPFALRACSPPPPAPSVLPFFGSASPLSAALASYQLPVLLARAGALLFVLGLASSPPVPTPPHSASGSVSTSPPPALPPLCAPLRLRLTRLPSRRLLTRSSGPRASLGYLGSTLALAPCLPFPSPGERHFLPPLGRRFPPPPLALGLCSTPPRLRGLRRPHGLSHLGGYVSLLYDRIVPAIFCRSPAICHPLRLPQRPPRSPLATARDRHLGLPNHS